MRPKNQEVLGRSTSFRPMSSLADLAFRRITRDQYRERQEQEVVSRVRLLVDAERDVVRAAPEEDNK